MDYWICFIILNIAIVAIVATSLGISAADDQLSCNVSGTDLELIVASGSALAFVICIAGLVMAVLEKNAGTVSKSSSIAFWAVSCVLLLASIIIDFLTTYEKTDGCHAMRLSGSLTAKGLVILISLIHITLLLVSIRSPNILGYQPQSSQFGRYYF